MNDIERQQLIAALEAAEITGASAGGFRFGEDELGLSVYAPTTREILEGALRSILVAREPATELPPFVPDEFRFNNGTAMSTILIYGQVALRAIEDEAVA